jgi:hypothetical protein
MTPKPVGEIAAKDSDALERVIDDMRCKTYGLTACNAMETVLAIYV